MLDRRAVPVRRRHRIRRILLVRSVSVPAGDKYTFSPMILITRGVGCGTIGPYRKDEGIFSKMVVSFGLILHAFLLLVTLKESREPISKSGRAYIVIYLY